MHRHALSLLAASLLGSAVLFAPSVGAAQDYDAEGERTMLENINALRAAQQLPPVSRLPDLDAIARAHASDMASQGALAHVSETTGTPEDRVRSAGVSATEIAENVAAHHDTASAHEALLQSPPHRANILGPNVTHVGLGALRSGQGVYVTQVFTAVPPAEEAPAEEAPAVEPLATLEEVAPEPLFQLIPPFVEQILGSASPSAPTAPAAEVVEELPEPAVTGLEEIEDSAAEQGSANTAATTTPSTPDPSTTSTAAALRQLVGLAQSLLGGIAQP